MLAAVDLILRQALVRMNRSELAWEVAGLRSGIAWEVVGTKFEIASEGFGMKFEIASEAAGKRHLEKCCWNNSQRTRVRTLGYIQFGA